MKHCYQIPQRGIRLKMFLTTFLSLFSLFAWAQPTATISSNSTYSCEGSPVIITFTGANGTAPYVFTYTSGGVTQTVSSTGNIAEITVTNPAGNWVYTLTSVADANGSTAMSQALNLYVSPLPNVNAGPDFSVCAGSMMTLCATGAQAYTWSNGMTATCTPVQAPMVTTTYTVTGSIGGCTNTDQVTVTVLTISPPTVTAVIDTSYCTDGSIALTITGSTPPYSFQWPGGNTSAMISSLPAGTYDGLITDGNGCQTIVTYVVPAGLTPSSCAMITGSVFYDENENCAQEGGEAPLPNHMIVANPGNYIAFTDQNGDYELNIPPGSYVVEEVFNSLPFAAVCNPNYAVTLAAGQASANNDFADTINGGADFKASHMVGGATFGNNVNLYLQVSDLTHFLGLENMVAWFTIPANMTLQSFAVPHTISNDTVYYNVDTTNVNYSSLAVLGLGTLQLGDTFSICSGASSTMIPELNLVNNVYCLNDIVVGPYDPNDIRLFVHGMPSDSWVLDMDLEPAQTLDYIIRFQNTGTAESVNVYVLDTISDQLDISAFELISTSHHCNVSLLGDNVLRFDFPLIHLPDSNANEPGSHGFIHYRIKQHPDNVVGDIINNTGYIYFDYNEAVITNTTHDVVVTYLGTEENELENLQVFPNPSESKVQVKSGSVIQSLQLFGLNGQLLQQHSPQQETFEMDLSKLDKGVYLLRIETEKGTLTKKIQKI